MIVYVLVIESIEGEIEECKVMQEREIASNNLTDWVEEHGIVLDTDVSESEIYFCEDEEGEYIYRIIDHEAGEIRIFTCELESY